MTPAPLPGSASLRQGDYWWHRARVELLRVTLSEYAADAGRLLDVGSADGPSVGWLRGRQHVQIDVGPRGLSAGSGVCGSALALPFADRSFDVVAAFDVLEHCDPERRTIAGLARVLDVGGRLLLSVPVYQWDWTDHDVRAGHHRRYTRDRLVDVVSGSGLRVQRATYAFTTVFPFFVAERVVRRLRHAEPADHNTLPSVPPVLDRLLMRMSGVDQRLLRRRDLPFGSSVLLAAVKTAG